MRLVRILGPNTSKSIQISEPRLETLILTWDGKIELGKSPYEKLRLSRFNQKVQLNELLIIYRDNRILRSKNSWFEWRCLNLLANHTGITWRHSVTIPMTLEENNTNFLTEIDGISVGNDKIGVEIKFRKISKKYLNFYERKATKLNLTELHLMGLDFPETIPKSKYPHLKLWKVILDEKALLNFYQQDFSIPNWFRSSLGPRHFKFLLTNGRWQGNKRRIGDTSKSTAEDKLRSELNRINKTTDKFSIKIYYSLARCLDPIGEFKGKGWMSPPVILAFDFDFPSHEHIFGKNQGCFECNSKESIEFGEIIYERFEEEGYYVKQLFSGAKGFHFYVIDGLSNKVKIIRDLTEITTVLDRYKTFDDFRSEKLRNWDLHRIFKLPGSVDASTGQKIVEVNNESNKLVFKDKLIPIN